MPTLPTGTVTFLYTDIEGSTRLLQALEDRYADVAAQQRHYLVRSVQTHSGAVVDAVGDTVFAVFARAKDAAAAAVDAQRWITAHSWPQDALVRIRMGLHTGEPTRVESGYVGIDVHRAARICAAGHGGQILLSSTTRELIADDLPAGGNLRDLGEHRLKDLARPLHLYQLVVPDILSEFLPIRTLSVLPNNLPSLLTTFVGRQREMSDIKQLLSSHRLVTLTGVGGGGKTRLALQIAAEVLESYADGVWAVELTPLTDRAFLEHTILSVLGIREDPTRPIQQTLTDYLGPRRLLLMLDNCEHLLKATAGLTQTLLLSCPNLRILATSREPLRVNGEVIYRLSSLQVPKSSEATADQLVEIEATRLFIDRAIAMLPGFKVHVGNAKTIATICRRLDGIPLAIELAASRMRALSLDQIAERLEDRFALLTEHAPAEIRQHQTLQAALDWSHELLSSNEQIAFRRLSEFASGFTLEAAEQVCGGDPVDTSDVLDLVSHLVDKSLVQYEPEQVRYDLLETVRQYARRKLREANEESQVRGRHLEYFLVFAEEADLRLRTAEAPAWLDHIDDEHDNLRAALSWSLERGDVTRAARIGKSVWWFWLLRGHWAEGRDWLQHHILKRIGTVAIGAKILNGAAMLAYYQSNYKDAKALASEALTLSRSLTDISGEAYALCLLAQIERASEDYDRVVALGEQSVKLFRQARDTWGSAYAHLVLGSTIERDDHERAVSNFRDSLRLFRAVGDPWGILRALARLARVARTEGDYTLAESLYRECHTLSEKLRDDWERAAALVNLGRVARIRGNYDQARKLLEQSLALFERLGDKNMTTYPQSELALLLMFDGDTQSAIQSLTQAVESCRQTGGDQLALAVCLHRLGFVRQVEASFNEARAHLQESLELYHKFHEKVGIYTCLSDLGKLSLSEGAPEEAARLQTQSLILCKNFGAKYGVAQCLERMAPIAVAQEDHSRAARLLGAADAVRESIGVPLPPTERLDHDQTVATAQSELGLTSFSAARSEGRALTLEQAVDYALAVDS